MIIFENFLEVNSPFNGFCEEICYFLIYTQISNFRKPRTACDRFWKFSTRFLNLCGRLTLGKKNDAQRPRIMWPNFHGGYTRIRLSCYLEKLI